MEASHSPLLSMIRQYQELNRESIEELDSAPSPLEFMRYVAKNRPFVVRRGIKDWQAAKKWNAKYLVEKIGNCGVKTAITPNGRADAPTPCEDGLYFVKPYEKLVPFRELLSQIQSREESGLGEIWYGQTQNDNLRGEYSDIFNDVEPDIPWARIALGKKADAINFWIGGSASVTATHRDNYENIFCQISGRKHFVLASPLEAACVNEQLLPQAAYIMRDGSLVIEPETDAESIPCAMWDFGAGEGIENRFSPLCMPIEVDLEEGDLLYLPAMWYHKVSQSAGDESFCCAVNYWYDMEFEGPLYASSQYFRDVSLESGS